MMIPPMSSAPEPFSLRRLTLTPEDRNEFAVQNKHLAVDGNDDTYANAEFWGAGQGLTFDLGGSVRLGAVRFVADTFEGPEFGGAELTFSGVSMRIPVGAGKRTLTWEGDMHASTLDVVEYARTRIYTVEAWELVSEATAPPSVEMPPTPLEVATTDAVAKINGGQALAASLIASGADNDFTYEFNEVNSQISHWQELQLKDPGNGDTQGTLGYFAVSARDFWSQIGDLFDAGAPPAAIQAQFHNWSVYSASQQGKAFEDMQPIDLWWQENGG